MADVRLKFEGGEFVPKNGVTTLGRTTDNDVSFPSDTNVSRYHAEVELRGGEFCLIDLSSSNGTTVNGSRVNGEVYLRPGDRIVLGGSSEICFEETREAAGDTPAAQDPPTADGSVDLPPVGAAVQQIPSIIPAAPSPAGAGSRMMLMIAGGAVLIAVVVVGVAGAIYYKKSGASCTASVRIASPDTKDTIYSPTEIQVETTGGECVKRAVFTLDGVEFDRRDERPYTATLDPSKHPDQADAGLHSVAVTLLDERGKPVSEPAMIELQLETRKAAKEEEEPKVTRPEEPEITKPAGPASKEMSLIDLSNMTSEFAGKFGGSYSRANNAFLSDVQKSTAEYAHPGFYQKAAAYKDVTNIAFVRDNGLPPALGFVLAMSRTGFDARGRGGDEGIWRLSRPLVESKGYGGKCTEPLTDVKQSCSAAAAADYVKDLLTACGEDFMCVAAAFGKSSQDAGAWRSGLPNGGRDLWNTLRPGPEREQLVRFVAAGLVAGNPQSFGLAQERPISTLFP